jgi:cellulose synthase/poly-beta-1,6-N-acetylglucosamine synthase-like glycosyltransferase
VLTSEALPTVSVVVTGQADREWTLESLRSLLALRYPRHEVVVVHDGASSGFLPSLIDEFDLYEVPPAVLVNVPTGPVRGYYRSRRYGKLFVIDKPHAGRADDLNAALNASRFPYLLTLDVGTRLTADALTGLMRPFLLGERVAAVAAPARIGDRRGAFPGRMTTRAPSSWLEGVQAVETLRDLTFVRLGWNRFGGQLPSGAAVRLHRRDHLLELDGYRAASADPQVDLAVRLRAHLRLQRLSDAIPTLADMVAWTLAPTTASEVSQRHREAQRSTLDELRSTGGARRAWRQGGARRVAASERMALALAPFLELAGYLLLVATVAGLGARGDFIQLFLMAVPGYAVLLSLWVVALEAAAAGRTASWRASARLCAYAVVEQLGYRQWVSWTRVRASWAQLRRRGAGRVDGDAPERLTDAGAAPSQGLRTR